MLIKIREFGYLGNLIIDVIYPNHNKPSLAYATLHYTNIM